MLRRLSAGSIATSYSAASAAIASVSMRVTSRPVAALVRECPFAASVTVAFETGTGHGAYGTDRDHARSGFGRDVNRDDSVLRVTR